MELKNLNLGELELLIIDLRKGDILSMLKTMILRI